MHGYIRRHPVQSESIFLQQLSQIPNENSTSLLFPSGHPRPHSYQSSLNDHEIPRHHRPHHPPPAPRVCHPHAQRQRRCHSEHQRQLRNSASTSYRRFSNVASSDYRSMERMINIQNVALPRSTRPTNLLPPLSTTYDSHLPPRLSSAFGLHHHS